MADRRALWGFHRDGFAVLEQGILGDGGDGGGGDGALSHDAWIAACERRQREVMHRWYGGGAGALGTTHLEQGGRRTPVAGTRAFAATFLELMRLGGEEALALVESPRVLELARRALGCEEVVIDQVSCGDPLTLHGDSASQGGVPAAEGWQQTDAYNDNVLAWTGKYPSTAVPENQFIWHTDRAGRPQHEMRQVYFRSVLDPQLGTGAEGGNARLRLWPGSQNWSERRLDAQLDAMAQAEGGARPGIATQDQPEQVVVDLAPQQTLMWCEASRHPLAPTVCCASRWRSDADSEAWCVSQDDGGTALHGAAARGWAAPPPGVALRSAGAGAVAARRAGRPALVSRMGGVALVAAPFVGPGPHRAKRAAGRLQARGAAAAAGPAI